MARITNGATTTEERRKEERDEEEREEGLGGPLGAPVTPILSV
jgi:hypothetical protein